MLLALTIQALVGNISFSSHVLECPGSFMFSSMELVKLIKPNFEIWNIILFASGVTYTGSWPIPASLYFATLACLAA